MISSITRNTTPQLLPVEAQRGKMARLDNSPPLVRTMDLCEVKQLSRVAKFIVLFPAPGSEDEIALTQIMGSEAHPRQWASLNVLELFNNSAGQSKNIHADRYVLVGDVKVNFSTMEADRKGEPLLLTALEFKTLKYLIENARRVISRDELLNEVWGYQNYPSTRTVDNQVSKLRKKLEQDPSRPVHLRTVHGAGYKFLP
jgi:hypothetical protein